jgi:hypothetical protein
VKGLQERVDVIAARRTPPASAGPREEELWTRLMRDVTADEQVKIAKAVIALQEEHGGRIDRIEPASLQRLPAEQRAALEKVIRLYENERRDILR